MGTKLVLKADRAREGFVCVKLFQNIDPEKLLVIMSRGQPGAFWVVECQEQNTAHVIVHTPHRLHCSWIYCCLLLL